MVTFRIVRKVYYWHTTKDTMHKMVNPRLVEQNKMNIDINDIDACSFDGSQKAMRPACKDGKADNASMHCLPYYFFLFLLSRKFKYDRWR